MSEFEYFDKMDDDCYDDYYDDYYDDEPFAEMMENEDFAQDGDFHNMEFDLESGCWEN